MKVNHLANWGMCSVVRRSQNRAAWSVLIICLPKRYCRNCLSPFTRARSSFLVTSNFSSVFDKILKAKATTLSLTFWIWNETAPRPKSETSMSRTKVPSFICKASFGSLVSLAFSLSKISWHSLVYSHWIPFFINWKKQRSYWGEVLLEAPIINASAHKGT